MQIRISSSYAWLMVAVLAFIILKLVPLTPRNDETIVVEYDELQPYRTAYHFQPPKNWINDPNGPMYYNGVYHLFYQYNPHGATWAGGLLSWGHSVSYNLVDWIHLEPALDPTDPFDINGCWSGSATILPDGTPAILYTGRDSEKLQVQNLAVPKDVSDPYLREWKKYEHNPIMTPVDEMNNEFRDPTTAWQGPDGKWRVLIGCEINGQGAIVLYHSENFVNWTKSHRPLCYSKRTKWLECPDFFPVSVDSNNGVDTSVIDGISKHVFKASLNTGEIMRDYYVLVTYQPESDKFVVDGDAEILDENFDLSYDYGVFYGSKTFYDSAQKRRVVWGWVKEAETLSNDIKKGWSGLQGFPRSIWLDEGGKQLLQWPVREIESLHTKEVNIQDKDMEGGAAFEISGITASQADIDVSFHLPDLDDAELLHPEWRDPQVLCSRKNASAGGKVGPFGLMALASNNLTEYTAIFFRVFKGNNKYVVLMCSDQSRSSLREEVDKTTFGAFVDVDPKQTLSLRTLIDHSIIENFGGGGKACITARVYPQLAVGNEAHLHVFNYGAEKIVISNLSAWSMKAAQMISPDERQRSEI